MGFARRDATRGGQELQNIGCMVMNVGSWQAEATTRGDGSMDITRGCLSGGVSAHPVGHGNACAMQGFLGGELVRWVR